MNKILHPEQIRALRRMSQGQRLAVNASLWDHARTLKEATLRARHHEWTDDQIRQVAREAFERAAR